MDRRFTAAIVIVFVALAAFAVLTQRDTEPVEIGAATATATPAPLLDLDTSEVEEVGGVDATGGYTLTRVAGGWEVDGVPAADEVDGVVNGIGSPDVRGEIPADRDPDDYGFPTPTLTVTLLTAGGDRHVIVVGDQVPMSSDYYVRIAGEDRIVWIGGLDIDRLVEWLTDSPLAPTATPEVTETPEGYIDEEGDEGEDAASAEDGAVEGEKTSDDGETPEGEAGGMSSGDEEGDDGEADDGGDDEEADEEAVVEP